MEMESLEEYEAVVSTMKKYVEACSTGDVDLCKEAFYENAVMYGYLNGTLYNGSINNFYEALKQVGGDPGTKTRIDVLALVGTEAVVRVVMNDWHQCCFTDFHTLLKIDGKWKIISKCYHQY